MNNATRTSSILPLNQSPNDQDESFQDSCEEPVKPLELNDKREVLSYLDELNFSPRAVSITAIMNYAHGKNEAVH